MEYRNLSNFALSLLLIISFVIFVPVVNNIFTAISITFLSIRLAEWLMEITRKYFLYERVSPENKVILITGCDSGFGNALARRMDKLGYSVLATCLNPDGEGSKKLSQECSERLTVLQMDVTDEQSIQKVKAFVESNLERNALWAIINNAGIFQYGRFDWTSVEEFKQACDVNAFGALRVTKAFLSFIKRSEGRIVNVTSIAGRVMIPGLPAYCASKTLAVALTTQLQMELTYWGVKCISIEPYVYATPMAENAFTVLDKTWNTTTADVRNEYGTDYFETFKTETGKMLFRLRNTNISQVIDCLEDAITAVEPLPIYTPSDLFNRTGSLLYRALPYGMKEYLAGYILDGKCKPLALQRKEKEYLSKISN